MSIKKILIWGIIILVVGFVAIQLLPFGRDHTNPPVVQSVTWDSPRTEELARRACMDCHSNETVWPWYSNIAPVSWLLARDVNEGRQKMNLSDVSRIREVDEIGELVNEGEMPMPIYLITHPEARLTDAEKQELVNGLYASLGR